jgi:CRISPR-associated protein Cmr2
VGLAIIGFQEPMELSLNYARQAEKAAKGTDRDGLAIHYHPGSGAPILVRGRWVDGIAARLEKLTVLHRDNLIGDKAAYDLRELSRLYENWPQSPDTDRVLRADVDRLLSRKPGAQAVPLAHGFSEIKDSLSCAQDVVALANQVIITRLLGKAQSVSGWSPADTADGGQKR